MKPWQRAVITAAIVAGILWGLWYFSEAPDYPVHEAPRQIQHKGEQ